MLTFPTLITGTITDLRISAVDGTAFLDNCAALVPYADGNHQIEIYDSSNRMLKGVLKAAGSAETLGDELITGGSFTDWTGADPNSLPDGWSAEGTRNATNKTQEASDACQLISDGTLIGIKQTVVAPGLGLFYQTLSISALTGSGIYTRLSQYGGVSTTQQTYTTTGDKTAYYTRDTTGVSPLAVIRRASDTTTTDTIFDSMSVKQVLTPSSSGATIVSAKGGAIYNFTSKDASFTYNAASYRYAIYDTLKVSRPTRYMGVSTHNI